MPINNVRLTNTKEWFIKTALSYIGTPYIWGGDDPSGFDCSGFVVECLKSVGLLGEHEDFTADGLYRRFKTEHRESRTESSGAEIYIAEIASEIITGVLLFRIAKNGRATHVVICLDRWFQIGASGGGRDTKNIENSWAANAYVKIRPIGEISNNIRFVNPFANLKD